jgi:hypothetical protein
MRFRRPSSHRFQHHQASALLAPAESMASEMIAAARHFSMSSRAAGCTNALANGNQR